MAGFTDPLTPREKDYSEQKNLQKQFAESYKRATKGYEDKQDQTDECKRYWAIFNCKLNENQAYMGNSQIFVPIVHDAIEARQQRFMSVLFPMNDRSASVISAAGPDPKALTAMIQHYLRKMQFKSVIPEMLRGGDVTGQYSLLLSWEKTKRFETYRKQTAAVQTELGDDVDGSEVDDVVIDEEVEEEGPSVRVIASEDLCVLPTTAQTIEKAELVCVRLRLSKEEIKARIRDGYYTKKAGEQLMGMMGNQRNQPDPDKISGDMAGVKTEGSKSIATVFQIWTTYKVDGDRRRCVSEHAGENLVLMCRRNPNWNDRIPVLSHAREKVGGSFWGKSGVKATEALQYAANDAVNMGWDSAQYSLLPIVMTDPLKNPRVGSMVLAMAAVWETSPNDTKFAQMPALWKDALTLVNAAKDQIMQSLGTNPAMIPQGNAGKKPTQSQIAQEQQVAFETSVMSVEDIEDVILSEVLHWIYDMDAQYRESDMEVQIFGELGQQIKMETIPPFLSKERYIFQWVGSEGFKSMQQVQQQIATMNVLKGIPPNALGNKKLDLSPIIDSIVQTTYGPRLAPRVLVDQTEQLSMDPEMENQMMGTGIPLPVHMFDDDQKHIVAHFQLARSLPPGSDQIVKVHMMDHMTQMQAKSQAQAQQMGVAGAPPMPGQPGAGGQPGQPRPGAMPAPQRPVQNPPGAIHPDQMPLAMPRR